MRKGDLVLTKKFSVMADLNTVAREVEFSGLHELEPIITVASWSPALFNGGHRKSANMSRMDVFAVDIDGGLPLSSAIERVRELGLSCLIGTSKSHGIEKKGVIADRYRIVFDLSESLTSPKQVRPAFEAARMLFPQIDEACKDAARFFYPCMQIVYRSPEGATLSPSAKNPLSAKTWHLLQKGAPEGARNEPFVAAAHDAIQQKWTLEEYKELLGRTSFAWLTGDEYASKLDERYQNFSPAHPPRPLVPTASSGSSGGGKVERMPLNLIKAYLESWLVQNDVAVSYNRTIYLGQETMIGADIVRKVILALAAGNLAVDEKIVEYCLQEWIDAKRLAHLEDVQARLATFASEVGEVECRKFLAVLKASYTELDLVVLKHMLWQVKRKINGLRTKHEMMLVLTGDQGVGKSSMLRDYLFKPLGDLAYSGAGFQALADERQGRLFSDHYIILFDEMSGAARSDMERTKQLITSTVFKQRRMGTTSHDSLPMNATFFGTANYALDTLIKDNTGMRRFGELKVDSLEEIRRRWADLKAIDVDALWGAVDAQADEPPISAHMDELKIKQEEIRDKSVVEFMLHEGVFERTEGVEDVTSSLTLAQAVSIYMGQSWSAKSLAKEWSRFGVAKVRTRCGSAYAVKINDSSLVDAVRRKYGIYENTTATKKGEF